MSNSRKPLQLLLNKRGEQNGGETANDQRDGVSSRPRLNSWEDLISLTRQIILTANRADFAGGDTIDLLVGEPDLLEDDVDSDVSSNSSKDSLDPEGEEEMLTSTLRAST